MNKSDRYFYDKELWRVVTNPYPKTIKADWVEIKEGYVLTDGRTVVDDRDESIWQMVKDGRFNPTTNAPLTNVVLNPLIYL